MLGAAASPTIPAGPAPGRPRRWLVWAAGLATRWLWCLALGWLGIYLAIYFWHAWHLLRFPFAVDQGEAYDAYAGWLINLGRQIYSQNDLFPYFSSNYPPVYSYLVSIPMAWVGPSIPAARLISIVSALAVGCLIAWVVWQERRSAAGVLGAAAALLLFFGSNYVYHTTPLARVNATALFFALAALVVLWRGGRHSVHWSAILLLAALYTKQTTLDAAVAAGLWLLAARRWHDVVKLSALVLLPGLAILLALEWLSGGQFWWNVVLANANPWDLHQAARYYGNFLELHAIVVALAIVQTGRELFQRRPSLFGLYLCVAAAFAVTAGKWGSGESYFLAPIAAASLQAGRLIGQVSSGGPVRAAVALLLLAQCVLFAHGPVLPEALGRSDSGLQAEMLGWTPGPADLALAEPLVAYASAFGGPVLAETPDFVLEAGKPVVGNATHLRNLWLANAWDATPLVQDLAARRYDFVFLEAHLYPPPVLEAIGRSYYLYAEVTLPHRRVQVFAPGFQEADAPGVGP